MTPYVPGCGPRTAKIVIVGEAPGAEEEALGQPFVGGSGRLLTGMLMHVGIVRETCYLTNVMKVRPPGNDFGFFYEDPRPDQRRRPKPELVLGIEELVREIAAIKPNLIIALGGEALKALTGKRGIEKWRGSVLSTPHGKLIATHHPAAILREYPKRTIAELDLARCREEALTPAVHVPTCNFTIAPTFDQVMEFLNENHTRIAFDIETSGPHVQCLGLSNRPNHAICIPFISNPIQPQPGGGTLFLNTAVPSDRSYWTEAQEYEILSSLDRLFRSAIPLVAQNFPFDALILSREFGFDFRNVHMDTMVAHHACYCELPKGLDFLASIYTRHAYYSDYEKSVDRSVWIYNCYDACCTLEISHRLDAELAELGLEDFYFNNLHPALLAAVRCETRGILIDVESRRKHREGIQRRLEELTGALRMTAQNPTFNPNSDKQVKDLLYRQLRMTPIINRRTKAETTDKNALPQLRRKYPHFSPVLDQLEEHSKLSTLLSGFLNKDLDPSNKIYTHYNVAGTVTNRWSSRGWEAFFGKETFPPTTNLQNIPIRSEEGAKIRACFLPDPGQVWMKCDYKQAEWRIVIWAARVKRIIERFQTDPSFDPFLWLAGIINQIDPKDVTKYQRSDAKNGSYGGNYGMRPEKASMVYKIPLDRARFVLSRYHAEVPEIAAVYWKEIAERVSTTRVVVNPLGRRRLFLDRIDDDLLRQAYSDFAQSTVACLINRAFSILDDIFRGPEARLKLQVHDEIDLSVDPDRVQETARIVKNVMEYPLHFPGIDVPLIIPAEISAGPNWYEQKEVRL